MTATTRWKALGPWDGLAKLDTDNARAQMNAEYREWLGDDHVLESRTEGTRHD